jgi:transcriptional regulator with XRE-family HTH domain
MIEFANAGLGEVLQRYRKTHRLSQKGLAVRLGVNQSTVSRLLSGRSTVPEPKLVEALSRTLNLPEAEIVALCFQKRSFDYKYDVFLSHAAADTTWCQELAERLRMQGVRVWFDPWEIKPGHDTDQCIRQGLQKSRKLVTAWSEYYFANSKLWTLAETYLSETEDAFGGERRLIPLLLSDCNVQPNFHLLRYIDFRNRGDFDLRFRQLIEALDLPRSVDFAQHELDIRERGALGEPRGKRFEDEIAMLYRLLGFDVKEDTEVNGMQIDLMIQKREGGLRTQVIVECKDKGIAAAECDQILAQHSFARKHLPTFRWIVVSSAGFTPDSRSALENVGIDCITYSELLQELVPLEDYVGEFIREYESSVADPDKGWGGRDRFIRPDIETDITYKRYPAVSHFGAWLDDYRSNLLIILGDLGTGKTTLVRFLAYQLACSFRDDPLRHPAPVVIPLREVRKEIALDSIVIKHFRDRGFPGLSSPRFEHLLHKGRIVLFFDGFDEMADQVRWKVTEGNFLELRRAAEGAGKVILTCRTHYFKDRTEQLRLIGQGPSLTAAETALYRELRQQSNAEVVYLQEFSDEQIKAYLQKARDTDADSDWQKIETIYNLKDLAQRPLLLEMIVKSLPHLKPGEQVNAANLYSVYTNLWVERDFRKGRVVLTHDVKLALMTELAWNMWTSEKTSFSISQLTDFVARLYAAKSFEFGDQEADDIAREVQAASFLRRDHRGEGGGDFQFIHRSFGEFFLAKRILQAAAPEVGNDNLRAVLNLRPLDRKVIYFLTLLDERDSLCAPLQQILTSRYTRNASENALQILYWSCRVQACMEEKISNVEILRRSLARRIPSGLQLQGAALQEAVLEAASFDNASFEDADLTNANFNQCRLRNCSLNRAALRAARFERADFNNVTAEAADLAGASFIGAKIDGLNLPEAKALALHSQLHRAKVI